MLPELNATEPVTDSQQPTTPPVGRPMVELLGITKRFGPVAAVDDVSVTIQEGEYFSFLGPSGSGKTTVLRLVAGLLEPDEGELLIGGADMRRTPPDDRNLAVVFQSLALFPHLSVAQNIAFPLRMRRVARREQTTKVRAALELMQLPDIGDRRINELSGGQRQRVALARALVYEPALLLLDEPLSALDRRLREDMQLEISRLHREVGITILNVTHDQREAVLGSTRIAVMNDGKIMQCDSSRELFERPTSTFVAAFLGDPLLMSGSVSGGLGDRCLRSEALTLRIPDHIASSSATVVLRPELLQVVPTDMGTQGWDNELRGVVTFAAFDGTGVFAQVQIEDERTVTVHTASRSAERIVVGESVIVGWDAGDVPVLEGNKH
jgi:putative spermidine/putrescine transport system ATP-binding protein